MQTYQKQISTFRFLLYYFTISVKIQNKKSRLITTFTLTSSDCWLCDFMAQNVWSLISMKWKKSEIKNLSSKCQPSKSQIWLKSQSDWGYCRSGSQTTLHQFQEKPSKYFLLFTRNVGWKSQVHKFSGQHKSSKGNLRTRNTSSIAQKLNHLHNDWDGGLVLFI